MNYRHFKYEGWLYALAFFIALFVRFIGLGAIPLTDAEAAPALQALRLSQSANPALDPHPLYILSTSFVFLLYGGGTNFLARFIPALIGSLLVLAPRLLDDRLKPRPSLILAFFLALDPGLVAISRQVTSPILAITFLAFTAGFINKNKPNWAAITAALALLSGPSVWFGLLGLGITFNLTFNLRPSTSMAIVGPSGAGKSTIANLLLRFWDYQVGEITLGGESLKALNQDEVRARCGYVSQNTYFFNTSIYENLRFARKKVTREEVEAACQSAQIHDFIMSLPKGYDTLIGEQGLRLSGGERQRLAIARALIKDAPILILDEPTANLDPLTEQQVLETLFKVMKQKTSILITHRLIGLENVDEILVINHGEIIERGTHTELAGRNSFYSHLLDLQNRILKDEN